MKFKKGFLILMIICLSAKLYSQKYDTIGTMYFKDKFCENINGIDSNGLRQGLWVDYVEESSGHSDFGNKYNEFVSYRIKALGHFINGTKTGEWNYFYDNETWTEFFNNDKSVIELRYDGELTNYYNFDSSIMTSNVIDEMHSDTFCIECIDKKTCTLYSGNIPLDCFDYSPINLFIAQQDIFLSAYRRIKLMRLRGAL